MHIEIPSVQKSISATRYETGPHRLHQKLQWMLPRMLLYSKVSASALRERTAITNRYPSFRFSCKSFSYFHLTKQCFLMNVTRHDEGVVLAHSEVHSHVEIIRPGNYCFESSVEYVTGPMQRIYQSAC